LKITRSVLCFIFTLLPLCTLSAALKKQKLEYYPWTFTSKAGSTGFAVNPDSHSPQIKTRLGFSHLPTWNLEKNHVRTDGQVDMKFFNFAALVDWHPIDSNIRLSSGLLYMRTDNKFDPILESTYNLSGHTYSLDDASYLNNSIEFDDFTPYIGIGWDTAFGKKKNFIFTLDLGVIYQSDPELKYNASRIPREDSSLRSNFETDRRQFEKDLERYNIYPVFNVGFSYSY
jgi:hypothetical protein